MPRNLPWPPFAPASPGFQGWIRSPRENFRPAVRRGFRRRALYNPDAAKPRMAAGPRRTMMSLEPQQARASHP